MKIVVNEMPKTERDCPFSAWKPNPPFIEEPGYWICEFSKQDKRGLSCNLGKAEHACRYLVQIPPQVIW